MTAKKTRTTMAKAAFQRFWNGITIEPIVACYMTAFTLITLTVSNLNILKACKVNLNLTDETCDALMTKSSADEQYEVAVQELVASMMVWQTCLQYAFPCLVVLLAGSWSDRTRRRVPCMLLPLYGELARNAGQLLCVYYFYGLPLEVAGVAETIPLALTGGQTMLTMTAYSYVGDATPVEHRTFRIGGVNAVMAISMAIGTSMSGIVYNKFGFYGAYGISSVLLVIGLLYGLYFVEDVVPTTAVNHQKCDSGISGFFDFKHITQSLKTTFKKRPKSQRLRIVILLVILMTSAGTNNGFRSISYLYTRVRFNWNEIKYSIYATYELLINITGLLFAVFVLNKLLKFSDEVIGILSTISQTLAALFYFFAYNELLFYAGPVVNILCTAENMSIKSLMTKSVPNTEISQLAAMFSIAEIIVSLVFGLMYSGIYEATLNVLPAAFYIITFIFTAPSIVLFMLLYVKRKRENEYSNDTLKREETPRLKSKIISNYDYGTIVKP